jgi:hypothetical protein
MAPNTPSTRPTHADLITVAETIAGRLGQLETLPGYSFGLDAKKCRAGSRLRDVPGSTCSGCYALRGHYQISRPLKVGQDRRHAGLDDPRWIDAMVTLITAKCLPPNDYFRWHDSGDIQSVDHLRRIAEVCRRTPNVKHWLPTRESDDVTAFLVVDSIPNNLVVRLSATMIDMPPLLPLAVMHLPTSTVQSAPSGVGAGMAVECRADELRNGHCGDCRACWNPRVKNVSYPKH